MIKTKFTDLNFQDPHAKHCLAYGGGKAGLLQFAKEKLPKIAEHVPDGVFINSADAHNPAKLESFLKSTESSSYPKIVRGCTSFVESFSPPKQKSVSDFCGVVDVLKTLRVDDRGDYKKGLKHCADSILEEGKTEEVKSHIEWEFDIAFNGNIGLLVQDYIENEWRGYIVEHQSEEGVFIVEKVYNNNNTVVSRIINDSDKEIQKALFYLEQRNLIPMYKTIKDSGLIPHDYTFQIEYCIDKELKPWILQVRLFRKKEERANFEVSPSAMNGITNPYNAFGVTPKDGLSLELCYLDLENIKCFENKKQAAYTAYLMNHESPPLNLQPKNLTGFIAQNLSNSVLGHGYTRFMMKTDVGIVTGPCLRTSRRVRIFSNGINGGYISE